MTNKIVEHFGVVGEKRDSSVGIRIPKSVRKKIETLNRLQWEMGNKYTLSDTMLIVLQHADYLINEMKEKQNLIFKL
jgi:hypothetical protein